MGDRKPVGRLMYLPRVTGSRIRVATGKRINDRSVGCRTKNISQVNRERS